ncbi:MAG: hypothetical protein ACLR0U_05010 [Enterocloster clostridioformis]
MIQKMLRDYYEIIEYDIKPRPVVMENIDKVINCGDPFLWWRHVWLPPLR